MCEFMLTDYGKPPYTCEYTGKTCTLCVLGNGETYKKATENEEKKND